MEGNQKSVASFGSHRKKKSKMLQTRFSHWGLMTNMIKYQDLIMSNGGPFLISFRLDDVIIRNHYVVTSMPMKLLQASVPLLMWNPFPFHQASFHLSTLT